ncbi:MAG: ribose-phosphate diphosphokinase [Candidatus Nanoarchaeia archaeon]
MRLFYTNSTKHLAKRIKIPKGKFILDRFSDGEIYVRINEDVKDRRVTVLASTPDSESILELMFLLDALQRAKAKIHLLMPYFGYARQDRLIQEGECFSSRRICTWLNQYDLKSVDILHMHSERIKRYLDYRQLIPLELFAPIIERNDIIVAPDKGALDFVKKAGKRYRKDIGCFEKMRPVKEKAKIIRIDADVKGRKVIIFDDMITTGGTILAVSRELKKRGAKEINVLATHGIFTGDSIKRLERSAIKNIYVTNSLPQTSRNIKLINIAQYLEKRMRSI